MHTLIQTVRYLPIIDLSSENWQTATCFTAIDIANNNTSPALWGLRGKNITRHKVIIIHPLPLPTNTKATHNINLTYQEYSHTLKQDQNGNPFKARDSNSTLSLETFRISMQQFKNFLSFSQGLLNTSKKILFTAFMLPLKIFNSWQLLFVC